jgi:hypothetical protein
VCNIQIQSSSCGLYPSCNRYTNRLKPSGFFTYHHIYYLVLFSLALQPSAGYGLLVHEVSWITHNDAPQSVGLLWMSDQLVAERLPDNTKHSKQTNVHAPGGIQTHDRRKRGAVDLHLRLRGHWDGESRNYTVVKTKKVKMGWECRLNGEIQTDNTDQKIRKKMIVITTKKAGVKLTQNKVA